ncbi:hypothetical protein LDENG_00007670 [Lucifuga dentata]|nr:hypothetical protein LDENG_00007670 [Lucifuga dentata]
MKRCGKMKLVLSGVLLSSLCSLSSWSVSSTFVVTQFPNNVTIVEGETVQIFCCWTNTIERGRVNWLKNQTEIKNELINKTHCEESLQNKTCNCSALLLSNIRKNATGSYMCKVSMEIPWLKQACGSSTVITMTTKDNPTKEEEQGDSWTLLFSVMVSLAPLLLITLICFCCLRRKQVQAVRVIYEVPNKDSEAADMDKHSTSSSRGSSEWCQVPVYESFDYFERVESKESG